MHHSYTRQFVTLGSALVLGLTCSSVQAQTGSKPPQKALIQFDSLKARWKSGDKPAEAPRAEVTVPQVDPAADAPRKALIPPNTIFNRNVEAMQAPVTSTPLPPTTMVFGSSPVVPVSNQAVVGVPSGSPIGTIVPPTLVAHAQLLAAQTPHAGGQAPVIIVMQSGAPGHVNFAPREVSPEVPNDFWPAESRNPLGRRDDHGLFTWPKFAKALANQTLETPIQAPETNSRALFGGAAPAETPIAEAPTNNTPKALFTRSEPAAPVQPESKALFGRSEPAAEVVAAPAPQQSRALLAKSQPAPAAAPIEVTPPVAKSRALFAFGRNRDPEPASPAPMLAPQMADANSPPTAAQMPMPVVEANEMPPEAPTLTEVQAAPPVPKRPALAETSPELKWRAKGLPRSEPVKADPPAMERVTDDDTPTEIVRQVVPTSGPSPVGTSAPSAVPAMSAPAVAVPQVAQAQSQPQPAAPQLAQQPPAEPTRGKALLPAGRFGRKPSQPSNVAPNRTDAQVAVQSTAPPAKSPAASPKPANEKALVPGLMAMITRVKEAGMDTETAEQVVAAPTASEVPVTHVAPAIDMASRRSYYAPPVEYVVDSASARKQQSSVAPQISHRKVVNPSVSEAPDVAEVEEVCEEDLREESDLHDEVSTEQIVEMPLPPVRRRPPAPPQGAQATKKKSYRRLTLQDLTAGFSRPLSAVNKMTKLPFPKRGASELEEPFDDMTVGAEPPAVAPAVREIRVTRRPAAIDDSLVAAAEEGLDNDVAVEVEIRKPGRRPAEARPQSSPPRFSPARQTVVAEVDPDGDPALASDDRQYDDEQGAGSAPQRLRSGRRQVTVPVVSLEEIGDVSTKDLPALQIRNRNGASVLIYAGSDASREEQASAKSGVRQNPLR